MSGLLSPVTTHAQPKTPTSGEPLQATPTGQPTALERENWRKAILATPRPRKGCFTAAYPERQWREEPCKTPPTVPYLPRRGGISRRDVVGGSGPDFAATVTGHISQAEGLFESATVSSVCSVACPGGVCPTNPTCGSGDPNAYSLQLNTENFPTSTCAGSPNPGCKGWQQFVYDSASGSGVIQYWLIEYGPAGTMCPMPRGHHCQPNGVSTDGWCPFQFTSTGPVYCVVNASQAANGSPEPITSLAQLDVNGAAAGVNGPTDSITVTIGGTPHMAP
ncbi:MAG TPA: hypothetical protein VEK55_09450, partial [Xanthobacteraceae bacterium]|nr:hypothetical protein [Xanthobacteraceae bacterium]